jgi:macrolide transport system ATP-binding/permease protein
MSQPFLKFHNVTFTYDTASESLFQNVSLHFAPGWSGVVGANGVGKTTLLKLATGLLEPDEGHINISLDSMYCPQRTDNVPKQFDKLLLTNTKSASIIKSQLGIGNDWIERWSTLSHGERKRAQIAVALWFRPIILAIDEPTNHVDAEAREIIAHALHAFHGVGLLVSHDRELLNSLCQQCVFIEPPKVISRPGGYTKGIQVAKDEQATFQKQYALKKQTYRKLKREATRRRELADQSRKRVSKKGIAKKDHDAKAKIDRARVTGKDAVGGKLLRQLDGRLAQAQQNLEISRVKKQYTLGIWLPGSLSKRDFLLKLPGTSLSLGGQKQLHYPDLLITPTDRIAITGPNGAGKSTLIRHIVDRLNVPQEHITYVPQEIVLSQSQDILAQARDLPRDKLGHLMTIVSRLGSSPHQLLDSTTPSPGETRKLLLALGMTRMPHIIIMDEPTNHMDLPSIECLEQALADCPCSLLLVSHDRRFLEKLTEKRWHITKKAHSNETFVLEILY